MLLNERQQKIVTGISYGFLIALITIMIILGVVCSNQKHKINDLTFKNIALTEQVDSLAKRCDQLGALNAVTVTSNLTITNKNYPLSVNTTQANLISKSIATATRQEVLDALDSLDKANKF